VININFGDLITGVGKFLAKYWQTIALIGLVGFLFFSRNNYSALKDSFDVAVFSYESEIAALKALYTEELEKRDEALRDYEDALNHLKEDYDDTREDLLKERQQRAETHVRDFNEQPEVLAGKIVETFGLEYVE
tara:strand:+ start:4092 stop:4493 length:402 start_codon:yes stop_codon:yes gene_type:complete